jgi:hypothetical protein
MYDAGYEAKNGEHYVDPEVLPDTDLQKYAERRQYDRRYDPYYVQRVAPSSKYL